MSDDNSKDSKLIVEAQWRTNYDYPNEGLYTNLDKYKSVLDFRRKRRAKRRKDIENILKTRPQ